MEDIEYSSALNQLIEKLDELELLKKERLF
jgi:hypothetical protein